MPAAPPERASSSQGSRPHNWHLVDARTADGKEPQTAIIPPGGEGTVTFLVAHPGTYQFQCDVSPDRMSNELTVK